MDLIQAAKLRGTKFGDGSSLVAAAIPGPLKDLLLRNIAGFDDNYVKDIKDKKKWVVVGKISQFLEYNRNTDNHRVKIRVVFDLEQMKQEGFVQGLQPALLAGLEAKSVGNPFSPGKVEFIENKEGHFVSIDFGVPKNYISKLDALYPVVDQTVTPLVVSGMMYEIKSDGASPYRVGISFSLSGIGNVFFN